jgi:radical SAM protein with 4Fe4S-binding SPASM domain
MNGLGFLNIELTSRCNKSCWMCGRRKIEREYPKLCNWGDMPHELIKEIADQVPKGIVVQFHNNGEPLLSPDLGYALNLFSSNIRCLNTNGKLLIEKADEIIGNLETLTVSVIQNDEEGDKQYETIREFLDKKGTEKPFMVYRLLGKVKDEQRWAALPGLVARRVLHSPVGSFDYEKKTNKPEIGICLDLLTHLAIDRFGNISLCVRFDPQGSLRIGNVQDGIEKAWLSQKRQFYIAAHLRGLRNTLPGCKECHYWGVPRGE